MITRKELKALIVKAECFGARVHVEQHVDHDGYFVVDSVRVTNAAGIGAVASVYASHILGVPFIPYRQPVPEKLHPVLVIDTAAWTGATIRKAQRLYGPDAMMLTVYNEPPMVRFWYEKRADNGPARL